MEKPLECSECQKEATISFTQLSSNSDSAYSVCASCPCIHPPQEIKQDLQCNECKTCYEEVLRGSPYGCTSCYSAFGDDCPKHVGRGPNEKASSDSFLKLDKLSEALSDALAEENYEEAAWLRDQIRGLQDG